MKPDITLQDSDPSVISSTVTVLSSETDPVYTVTMALSSSKMDKPEGKYLLEAEILDTSNYTDGEPTRSTISFSDFDGLEIVAEGKSS